MSATQLGEFITTPNRGSGTPITISVINGKQLPPLTKPENSLDGREENFKEKINKLFEDATTLVTTATNLLKQPGTLKAKEKEQLIKMCEAIKQEIT